MKLRLPISNSLSLALTLFCLSFLAASCHSDDDSVRNPADIIGVWSIDDDNYMKLNADNTAHVLEIFHQDSESIGVWKENVYLYEPGYNVVAYLDYPNDVSIFQIIKLTDNEMTWCWVKNIREEYENGESLGNIIGNIIKEAQDGFKLDPELYQTFHRISEDKFFGILEQLNITYPWIFDDYSLETEE